MTAQNHLLLLRHGKAASYAEAPTDFERPLRPSGINTSRIMGQWIRDAGLLPDAILSSTAVRAEATARLAAEGMGFDALTIEWEPRIYEATLHTLLYVLAERGGAHSRVMLVGHNPGMEWLTDFLAGGFEDPSEKRFPTAGLGVLELEHAWDDLKAGCARSVRVIRPRELVPN